MHPLLKPANPVWKLPLPLAETVPHGIPDLNHYPVQEEVLPGQWPPYHRPKGHWRCLYQWDSWGCVAVKGGESHSPHFDSMLEIMENQPMTLRYGFDEQPQSARLSILERFLFVENKFPGAVRLQEALDEARVAADFQLAHWQRFGELARVPLPLVVHQLPSGLEQSLVDLICRRLPERHHGRVRALLPLGVLVYWYPTLPERVSHLRFPQGTHWQNLSRLLEPRQVVDSWIELFTRCLLLGWVPCDPRSSLQGMCLEAQNLTLDGGMVDLDSMRRLETFRDARPAIERSFEVLAASIAHFLTGKAASGLSGPLRQQVLSRCQDSPHESLRVMASEDVYTATLRALS